MTCSIEVHYGETTKEDEAQCDDVTSDTTQRSDTECQGVTGHCMARQDLAVRFRTLQDIAGRYRTQQGITGFNRTSQGIKGNRKEMTGHGRALQDTTGHCRTLQDIAAQTSLDPTCLQTQMAGLQGVRIRQVPSHTGWDFPERRSIPENLRRPCGFSAKTGRSLVSAQREAKSAVPVAAPRLPTPCGPRA
jgi:hypothetical protein